MVDHTTTPGLKPLLVVHPYDNIINSIVIARVR